MKKTWKQCFLIFNILVIILLPGCSGYSFRKQKNPFEHYGIKSVAIPNFYNRSQLPRASSVFTSTFIDMFSRFKNLSVYTGENENADAYLIGIINSPNERHKTYSQEGVQLASSVAKANIGLREDFLVPSSTKVNATVDFYLIRNSNYEQIKYLINRAEKPFENIEVVLARKIPINFTFQRVLLNGESQAVNQTQSMGSYDQSLKSSAQDIADSFRYEVLLTF